MEKTTVNCVINRSAETIWKLVREFGKIGDWHPDLTSHLIENENPERIVREVVLAQSEKALERLIELNDQAFRQIYTFEEVSIPVKNYVGTFQLIPLSETRTQIIWQAEYACDPIDRDHMKALIENNIFKNGLIGLAKELNHASCIFS